MRHVQINNGVFVRHIFRYTESIQWDETNKLSVRKMTTAQRTAFGIEKLQMVTPPTFDPASQVRTEDDAVLIGSAWAQVWVITNLSGDELAEAQERQAEVERKDGLDNAVNTDSTLASLKAMTNSQFNAWWNANITDSAKARNLLKRLTRIMIRRLL